MSAITERRDMGCVVYLDHLKFCVVCINTKGMQLQFIVSRTLLISSATVIDRAGEANWLNYFATVLFNLCSTVTVECCILYPCCVGVFGMFTVM